MRAEVSSFTSKFPGPGFLFVRETYMAAAPMAEEGGDKEGEDEDEDEEEQGGQRMDDIVHQRIVELSIARRW